jgi:CheY-like chemotaxis protein
VTGWVPRSPTDVLAAQEAAVASYLGHVQDLADLRLRAQDLVETSREQRLDVARRADARRREHEVVRQLSAERVARTRAALQSPTAVLAHRSTWLRTQVGNGLETHGITVIASVENGAEASGTVIAEQPDLVLLEDLLPSMPGLQVARRARTFSPGSVVAAQVSGLPVAEDFRREGALVVLTRSVPPQVIVERMVRCLQTGLEDYALA